MALQVTVTRRISPVPVTIWECTVCGRQQAGAWRPRSCRCGVSTFEADGRCWQWHDCPGVQTSPRQRVCPVCRTSPFRMAQSRL